MAEKRTKADQLQRSIQRAENRRGTRSEEDLLEPKQGKGTVIPRAGESEKEEDEHKRNEAA